MPQLQWTAVIALWLDHEEQLGKLGLVGIAVGVVGVALLLGVELSGSILTVLGGRLLLVAGLGYAVGGYVQKWRLRSCNALGTVAIAMLFATVLGLPLTVGGQLGVERHGARTLTGLGARIGPRLLALAAGIWHNQLTGQPGRAIAAYGR